MSSTPNISVSSTASYTSAGAPDQPSLQTFAALDLSAVQRRALRSILAAAKQQGTSPDDVAKNISAVLTPAQQQALAARTPAARAAEQLEQPSTPAASTPAVSSAAAPLPRPVATAGTAGDVATNVPAQAAAQYTRISALLQQVRSTDPPSAIE
jgi:uncharacterized protein YdbL (DUF1318 family)